jgi:hypothetical protein
MEFKVSYSAFDLPVIDWEQDIPTGRNEQHVWQSNQLKVGAIIAIFVVSLSVANGASWGSALFFAAIVLGLCFGGGAALTGKGPDPAEARHEARRSATPVLERQKKTAELRISPEHIWFVVVTRDAKNKQIAEWGTVYENLEGFEVGSTAEWFGSISNSALDQMNQAANAHLIMAHTRDQGPLLAAQSAHDKWSVARLHGALRQHFIENRAKHMERFASTQQKPLPDTTGRRVPERL